jgi:DNA-binding MarR family transcriptional regulator
MSLPVTPSLPTPDFYLAGQYRPEQGVGYLMRNLLSSVRTQSNARMAAYDLTYVQWVPLFKLATQPDATVASLARDLEMDPGATTRALDRLEAKGLIKRERSTEDRRVVHLSATQEGRQLAGLVQVTVTDVLNRHLRGFSHEEWQTLVKLLTRMLVNAEDMKQEASE